MNTTRRTQKIIILLTAFAALFVLLIIPFDLVISPERRLTFVDDAGKPIAHAEVWQTWHQYSLGVSGDEIIKTDSDGKVYLPSIL